MVRDKQETIQKIKLAALEEFYIKGYTKASLRTICNRAGVTTGAMYFSFENKNDLFHAILDPVIKIYEKLLAEYMQIELKEQQEPARLDVLLMKFVLEHKKETIIIMEKSQGSCYEHYRQHVEELIEQSFYSYYQSRLKVLPDKGLIKLLAEQRLCSCLSIVKEDYDMEYSLYLIEQIGIHAAGGTEKLIQSLEKLHSNQL